jgi:hypothetical protein
LRVAGADVLSGVQMKKMPRKPTGSQTNHFLGLFKYINPTAYKSWFKNNTQRDAMELILTHNPAQEVGWIVTIGLPALQKISLTQQFVTTANTPLQLRDKYENIKKHLIKNFLSDNKPSNSSHAII